VPHSAARAAPRKVSVGSRESPSEALVYCKESVETALEQHESIPSPPRTYLAGYHRRYHGGETSKGITADTSQVVAQKGLKKSGRHDLNMRPLRPERTNDHYLTVTKPEPDRFQHP
jgi:hypothetical protein